MKLNFKPSKVAFLDFETQSEQELTSTRRYSRHPSTKALTCCVKVDGQMLRMGPYLTEADVTLLRNVAADRTLVAHNAPFDAAIWEGALGLPEAEWFDTLPCARAAGLPGGLDKLSKALGGRGKHKDGERLIKMLCIVRNGRVPAVGPAHQLLMEYNAQDVEELEMVYNCVKGFGEPDVMTVDRTINESGVKLDRALLTAISDAYDKNTKVHGEHFQDVTDGVNPKSPKQVKEWLISRGFAVESTNKFVMNNLIANPQIYYSGDPTDNEAAASIEVMQAAIEMKRELVGIGRGKLDAALRSLDDDDRLRDLFIYYGAHTGRWSSRSLQVHNLPVGIKQLDVRYIEPTIEAVTAVTAKISEEIETHVSVSDVLSSMLRRLVVADNLLVADYSAVEARCLAWVSGCKAQLKDFSNPHCPSPYLDMCKTVFCREIDKERDKPEYTVGKSLFLGAGYGMSGAKFDAQLNSRESREIVEKFRASGVTAQQAVKAYRTLYPEIPRLWKECGDAALSALGGVSCEAGKCFFHMAGRDFHIVLPSGRPIVYRNARTEMIVPMYCKMYNMPEVPIPTVVYDGTRGLGYLYGSKIVENICQAICRDLLAYAVVECRRVGLQPVIHVHDEILCDAGESRFEEMLRIMTLPPSWADGFPVKVEGYSGKQWSKVSTGYTKKDCQTGVIL